MRNIDVHAAHLLLGPRAWGARLEGTAFDRVLRNQIALILTREEQLSDGDMPGDASLTATIKHIILCL